jgi:environmental stress-induced protein Ves
MSESRWISAPEPAPMQLPRSARHSQLWANGQGVSHSVTWHFPENLGDEILWRINIADIPGNCEFSELTGIDRQFMLLDDATLTLDLGPARRVRPLETVLFAGEMAPACRASGPAQALNLLIRRSRAVGSIELVTVAGPVEVSVPQGGCVVVIKVDGEPTWPGAPGALRKGDAVRQDRPMFGEPDTFELSGNGRVVVISVAGLAPRERTKP